MGTVIGGLLLPRFDAGDYGQAMNRGILGGSQIVQGQTALLALAEEKQKQAAQQAMFERIQNDPELRQRLFGDSIIGSLGTAPGGAPPAPASITQSPLGGGPSQQIPAYPDASRFANVPPTGGGPMPPNVMGQTMPQVTPPQSVLGSLGPAGGMPGQPQGQMPGPQNALLEMARRDPRAALMLQQQMQAQQDRQWKMQEKPLEIGVKVAEFVARELQGVTDQASLDQARERIRQVHPQAAAQVPQMYSKEGVASVQQRGIAVAQRATDALAQAKARHEDVKTQFLPKLFEDAGTAPGAQAPGGGGTAPTTDQQARTAPPEFESAITDANRLYPQVSTTRIKSIIAAESNFDPKAESGAGAEGLMQLMPGTQKDMGVTNAYDPAQNIRGGTRYYAQMLTKYGGDERKALTAYNWGPKNLDDAGGDVTKAPAKTQAYVNRVLGGGGVAAGTAPAAPAAPADPRIAQLETQIATAERKAQQYGAMGYESNATQEGQKAQRLTAERTRLLEEARHRQERAEETPRAVEKERQLQPLKLEQQEAAAKIALDAKMNEPIGPENAINMNLPPQTRWKDVPKDVKITKQLGDTTAKQFSEFKASHAGLGRVLTMLDNPAAKSIIGTLFSGDNAAFRRRAGEWISSVTPQERKFVASLVAEIADIRHTLSGAAVSPTESEFLQPMMPSAADPDVGTVRAKLEALQEWMTRKHDAYRDQFEQSGYRVPAALARAEEKAPQGSGAVDKARDIMKPR